MCRNQITCMAVYVQANEPGRSPADYMHSSKKYYITVAQGIYCVTNYMELEDIDLTRKNRRVPHKIH